MSIHGSEYVVKRDLPNWEPCPDGSARTGHQIYRFYPVDERGWVSLGSTVLAGFDKTVGDSGACGINKALVIAFAGSRCPVADKSRAELGDFVGKISCRLPWARTACNTHRYSRRRSNRIDRRAWSCYSARH